MNTCYLSTIETVYVVRRNIFDPIGFSRKISLTAATVNATSFLSTSTGVSPESPQAGHHWHFGDRLGPEADLLTNFPYQCSTV